MALMKMTDDISNEIDNKIFSIGIFIDLSKAFDTIDHKLWIKNLQHYALDWFVSYLSNRSQYVRIQDSSSELVNITCGVPQGSILRPVLFIVYINDIVNASKLATFILFADDTNIFFKDKCLNTLYDMITDELCNIATWFKLNKLSLNVKKTNYRSVTPGNFLQSTMHSTIFSHS